MTRLSIPLAGLLLVLLAGWQPEPTTRFVLTEASTLWVTGTSSVHDWRCDAAQVDGWIVAEAGEALGDITQAEITMQADALSCKNGTMDRKTRGALKAGDHPTIRFELTAAEVLPDTANTFRVNTTGQLTIAGQTHTVTTSVQGAMTESGEVRLTGELPVTMSDYGIKPPTAMLGVLKTGDDVVVHFEVVAAATSDL